VPSASARGRGKGGKVGPPVHDDLVSRDFTADGPNRLWLADITEHRTAEGKLYLCAIKDVWSNRIVGYSIDSRMKSRLAVTALHNAAARRGRVAGCVLHTDRAGSQFRSRKFVRALHQHDMIGSMGRVGAAGDNAAMESFFGLLQNNVLDRRTWPTRQQLRTAIVTWIERTYHRRRRQRSLSRLTPIEYETIMIPPASQAAYLKPSPIGAADPLDNWLEHYNTARSHSASEETHRSAAWPETSPVTTASARSSLALWVAAAGQVSASTRPGRP
jgi:transposase InsO family protein